MYFWRWIINVRIKSCIFCALWRCCFVTSQCFVLCRTRLVKTCQTAAALLTGPAHAPQKQHTYTRVQSNTYTSARWAERRQPFSLCGLYVSADPALIQQTKLSLLNAQQKSSLSRHYAPVAPCSPSIHRPPSSPHIHSFTLTPDQCTHYTNCARRTLTVCMFCFSKKY